MRRRGLTCPATQQKNNTQPLDFAPFFVRGTPSGEKRDFSRRFRKPLTVSGFYFPGFYGKSSRPAEGFVRPCRTIRSTMPEDSFDHAGRFVRQPRRTTFAPSAQPNAHAGPFFSPHATPRAIHPKALVGNFHLSKIFTKKSQHNQPS